MRKETIHDLLYSSIEDICYDREYIYIKFAKVFSEFSNDILCSGHMFAEKKYIIPGIKSGKSLELHWRLAQKPSFSGNNEVRITARIIKENVIENQFCGNYELSLGTLIDSMSLG